MSFTSTAISKCDGIFRNIFTIYEDGIVLLKIGKEAKEGMYVCEATNGVGSAQTGCYVRIYRPEVSLDTTVELASENGTVDASVLSYSTSNFYSTVDVKKSENKVKIIERQWKGPSRMERIHEDDEKEEKTTAETHIPAGTLNYLVEAEALTITVTNYKLSVRIKPPRQPGKVRKEEILLKIIIEEDVVRTRYYLRVVQRNVRELWTIRGRIIERPPYWSQETTHEIVKFEKAFPSEKMHEFLEDKDIIERYIKLLQAAETSGSHEEQETRFTLRQVEGAEEISEERKLEIREEQISQPFDRIGSFKAVTVQCAANEVRGAVEAYVILITRYRYMATFDIRRGLHRKVTGEASHFEASIEDFIKRQKYFRHSILQPPQFVRSFSLFEEGYNVGLRCAVYGLPQPCIRILHNGRAIFRDNRSVQNRTRFI